VKPPQLPIEREAAYQLALRLQRLVGDLRWPTNFGPSLRANALKASNSVFMNICEGAAKGRHASLRIARGELGEVLGALHVAGIATSWRPLVASLFEAIDELSERMAEAEAEGRSTMCTPPRWSERTPKNLLRRNPAELEERAPEPAGNSAESTVPVPAAPPPGPPQKLKRWLDGPYPSGSPEAYVFKDRPEGKPVHHRDYMWLDNWRRYYYSHPEVWVRLGNDEDA
jgi:hypothetical protein